MNSIRTSMISVLFAALLLGSCGYYFPHVYDGPEKAVYMPTWQNRTNKLGLDTRIYQSLSRWFQKSEAIAITKNRESADLILAGEIVYIDLPSVSWGGDSRTQDVKVSLGVRYVLKDLKTGQIMWEVPNELWTEDYNSQTINATADNEALETIVDDLSEKIYLGVLERLRRQNQTSGEVPAAQ